MSGRPPLLARLLLSLLPLPHRTYVTGDLYEEYAEHVLPRRGRAMATLWLLGQSFRTVIAFIRYPPARRARVARRAWSPPRLSHAYRSWRRRPGLAFLAAATLGIGIGAATSVFSAADWILFRPVPSVVRPDRLVMIQFQDTNGRFTGISHPNLRDLGSATPALTHLAAYKALPVQIVSAALAPHSLIAEVVTGEYFTVLGSRAAAGRLIDAADAADGSDAVVVLSHALWRRAFDLSPDVVGSSLRLNGRAFTVIGVAAPGFRGVDRMTEIDLWVGGSQYSSLRHAPAGLDWSMTARDAGIFHGTVGRLRDGSDARTVEAELRVGVRALVSTYPEINDAFDAYLPTVFDGIGLRPVDRAGVASIVQAFAVIVLVTLLIACANVANLLVVRGIKRRGELAVRRALGESATHFYVQHTLEALLLAVPAALIGLLVASGLNTWLWTAGFLPTGPLPDVTIDWRVAGFAAAVAGLTALAFSILPAVVASRAAIVSQVNTSRAVPRGVTWMQGTFTITQLALSLALLAGAGVLARTILNLNRVDLGFSSEGVNVYRLDPGPQGYSHERNVAFHRDVLERLRGVPGVTAATATHEPFGETINFVQVIPPRDEQDTLVVRANWVTDEYFRTLDIPVLQGSGFRRASSEPAVILSEHTARELFGDAIAIGRTVSVASFSGPRSRRVVGVVGDVVSWNPRRPSSGMVYLPLSDSPGARAALLVRGPMPRRELDRAVETAVTRVDPRIPRPTADPMIARIRMSMAPERSLARIVGLLAGLACALAGVGLYSVIAYATTERTREFGIRMALGATDGRIVRFVFWRASGFGVWGAAMGVVASVALSRVIGSRVFGVAALDPVSLGVATVVLVLVSVAAAIVPAMSAIRVDPIRSLNTT